MVFICENNETRVKTEFIQLIQGNQRNTNPLLYFTAPRYLPSQLMKKNKVVEKTYMQVGNGFHM